MLQGNTYHYLRMEIEGTSDASKDKGVGAWQFGQWPTYTMRPLPTFNMEVHGEKLRLVLG